MSVDVLDDQSRNNHPYAKSINYVCGDVNSFRTPPLTCVARKKVLKMSEPTLKVLVLSGGLCAKVLVLSENSHESIIYV